MSYGVDDPAQDRLLVKRHADRRTPCFIGLMACYLDTSERVGFGPGLPYSTQCYRRDLLGRAAVVLASWLPAFNLPATMKTC